MMDSILAAIGLQRIPKASTTYNFNGMDARKVLDELDRRREMVAMVCSNTANSRSDR